VPVNDQKAFSCSILTHSTQGTRLAAEPQSPHRHCRYPNSSTKFAKDAALSSNNIHSPCASRRKQTVTQLDRHIRVCITLRGQSASTFRPITAKTNTFEISQSGHYCKAKSETRSAARLSSHRPCTPAYIVESNNEKRKEHGAGVMYSVHANRVILIGVGLATG